MLSTRVTFVLSLATTLVLFFAMGKTYVKRDAANEKVAKLAKKSDDWEKIAVRSQKLLKKSLNVNAAEAKLNAQKSDMLKALSDDGCFAAPKSPSSASSFESDSGYDSDEICENSFKKQRVDPIPTQSQSPGDTQAGGEEEMSDQGGAKPEKQNEKGAAHVSTKSSSSVSKDTSRVNAPVSTAQETAPAQNTGVNPSRVPQTPKAGVNPSRVPQTPKAGVPQTPPKTKEVSQNKPS